MDAKCCEVLWLFSPNPQFEGERAGLFHTVVTSILVLVMVDGCCVT